MARLWEHICTVVLDDGHVDGVLHGVLCYPDTGEAIDPEALDEEQLQMIESAITPAGFTSPRTEGNRLTTMLVLA